MDHNLEGYLFIHKDTPLIAGGSGLYISANLEYKVRNDLNLNVKHCEEIWAEITTNEIVRIFALIYRHPGQVIAILRTLSVLFVARTDPS